MTESEKFYTPVWEYQGFQLVSRRDSPHYAIYWLPRHHRRYKRKTTGTSDLTIAQQKLVTFAAKRARSTRKEPDEIELMPLVRAYADSGPPGRCHPATVRHLDDFCKQNDIVVLEDMTPEMQDEYVEWRRECLIDAGFSGSNATIARDLAVLRGAVNAAYKSRRLACYFHIRSVPPAPPRKRFLTQDEIGRLLAECHEHHLWLFVMCGLHTVQRPSAIFQLTTRRVDLDNRLIDFLPEGESQSHKGRPIVPITQTLYPHIKEAVEDSCSGHIIEFEGFPIRSVKTAFNKARNRAGLGPDVTPYVLRRTGATHMAAAGVPLAQIAAMMGHTIERTTEDYVSFTPNYLGQAKVTLDEVFAIK